MHVQRAALGLGTFMVDSPETFFNFLPLLFLALFVIQRIRIASMQLPMVGGTHHLAGASGSQ